jgi:tRNA threonylcarbamoyladenosine dehydratase
LIVLVKGAVLKPNPAFHRLEILVGTDALACLGETHVGLFGVGGVGSWCAESLIRSGIGHLTIVDSDVICATNLNRQLQTNCTNIGKPKVDELAARLALINPDAKITCVNKIFNDANSGEYDLSGYDYVVDAIDSIGAKTALLTQAQNAGVKHFCSLGASRKLDPTKVKVGSFWKVRGCPLGKHIRKRLRNRGATADFLAVHSSENLRPHDIEQPPGIETNSETTINGSAVHVTATFGFNLAGLVVQDVVRHAGALKR